METGVGLIRSLDVCFTEHTAYLDCTLYFPIFTYHDYTLFQIYFLSQHYFSPVYNNFLLFIGTIISFEVAVICSW